MNRNERILLVLGIGMLFTGASMFYSLHLQAMQTRAWRYQCFMTLDRMVEAMNLQPEATFHVVTVPSSRNVGGFIGSPYCVVTR